MSLHSSRNNIILIVHLIVRVSVVKKSTEVCKQRVSDLFTHLNDRVFWMSQGLTKVTNCRLVSQSFE